MKRILVLVCCSVFTFTCVKAQDPHFSQFFSSPLTLNPALTGKFDGNFRIAGNYRDQWPAISKTFVTSTFSIDAPILTSRIQEIDALAIGVMGMNDRTANGILKSNFISASVAYHKGLDEDGLQQLGFGFQGSYGNHKMDGFALKFEDGLTANGTWATSPTEPINQQVIGVNYFDFNAGLLYNGSTDGFNNFYLGASMYHINKPKYTFQGGFYTLNPRLTLHSGGYLPIGEYKTLHMSALHSRQAGAFETVVGGAVAFNVNYDEENPTSFYAGVWSRFNNQTDALIPYLGFEFSDFRIGATYDVNISSLKSASQSRGGLEVSLIYIKRPPGKKGIPCPKF